MKKTIESEIITFIKIGADKVESIKKLEIKYKVPFKQLDQKWLQVKSKMNTIPSTKEEREDFLKDLEKAPVIKKNPTKHIDKKVLEEIKAKIESKTIKDIVMVNGQSPIFKKAAEINIPYSVTEKEIKETQKEYSNLKIIEEIKKIQGKYGTYTKTLNGVKDGRNIFKDIKDIEQYKSILQKETEKQKKDFKSKILELNKQLEEVEEIEQREFKVLAEIEQVFSM